MRKRRLLRSFTTRKQAVLSAGKTLAIFVEISRNSHSIAAIFADKDVGKGRELGAVSFGGNSGSFTSSKLLDLSAIP